LEHLIKFRKYYDINGGELNGLSAAAKDVACAGWATDFLGLVVMDSAARPTAFICPREKEEGQDDDVLRRRRRHPTEAARRNFAGIKLQPTVFKSEGMGRERKVRGFHSCDSGKGKASGRGSAPSSHGCGHGSSWGAWLRQGEGGVRAGAGGGGYRGAHRGRNRTKMARLGRSTAAFVTLFLLEEQRRGN